MKALIAALWLTLALPALAGIEVRQFPNPALESRYQNLIEQLRCLVCQNQSLADSNADLAEDLRSEVYAMLLAGKSDAEIVDFLVQRYGDFVLYKPPVKKTTALLWFGPFAALAAGGLLLWRIGRTRRPEAPTALTPAERERLQRLLKDEEKSS
ncbi:cytochrome c-type biogenesis protein CcmH [Methylomarinovum tepidoasis]|uniref:Cytochrome c-type biogenesis protein n=1 Tax=Methylomarinovum tepidoasis TaxID=2840183 RepID=A0AAU9CAB2_9GAMM|nr:cytochrome c-type biogenesis protein [Methylomarinovum sp. IN45]BCX88877.1 cytochrome c-type biogenesis protein CcmH [Methylomarinovum sp. IN45]